MVAHRAGQANIFQKKREYIIFGIDAPGCRKISLRYFEYYIYTMIFPSRILESTDEERIAGGRDACQNFVQFPKMQVCDIDEVLSNNVYKVAAAAAADFHLDLNLRIFTLKFYEHGLRRFRMTDSRIFHINSSTETNEPTRQLK